MTTMTNTGKKQATKLLRSVGDTFMADFMSVYNSAIPLRSKEPGLCWKAAGQIAFAAINEFSGPNTMEDGAPLLMRLRTNIDPPPAISYHLKSPAIRNKLGVSQEPIIMSEPALELTAMPDEIGKFGKWLPMWLDSQFYQRNTCPTPPMQLISWRAGDDLADLRDDLMDLGTDWRLHLYLWTDRALMEFESWLKR